jgi:hypothetical protein
MTPLFILESVEDPILELVIDDEVPEGLAKKFQPFSFVYKPVPDTFESFVEPVEGVNSCVAAGSPSGCHCSSVSFSNHNIRPNLTKDKKMT